MKLLVNFRETFPNRDSATIYKSKRRSRKPHDRDKKLWVRTWHTTIFFTMTFLLIFFYNDQLFFYNDLFINITFVILTFSQRRYSGYVLEILEIHFCTFLWVKFNDIIWSNMKNYIQNVWDIVFVLWCRTNREVLQNPDPD